MKKIVLLLMVFSLLISCKDEPKKDNLEETKEDTLSLAPVDNDMLETAVIYEANIRQYSPEGTFDAFTKDIPQLKELGVKVIWLMPMYPISEKNRTSLSSKDFGGSPSSAKEEAHTKI